MLDTLEVQVEVADFGREERTPCLDQPLPMFC